MKFSVGDLVVLKRTGEEGVVTAYVDKSMIEVAVNGTVFPVYIEEVDHPYLKWFTDKKAAPRKKSTPEQLPVEKVSLPTKRLARGIYLSFLPVSGVVAMEEVVKELKVFLSNELPGTVKFNYDVRVGNTSLFSHEGMLHGFGNIYLHNVDYADMNDQPRFNWSLTDTGDAKNAKQEGVLRIKPPKLFEQVTKILEGNGSSFEYCLITEFREQKKEEAFLPPLPDAKQVPANKVTKQNMGTGKYEVDLHIEQLVENTRGLSNADIIKIQLDTLQHYLHLAIVNRQEHMVVIHGLGKGKLRDEVHAMLKATPEVSRYKNEWSGKYGFGATEITFKR